MFARGDPGPLIYRTEVLSIIGALADLVGALGVGAVLHALGLLDHSGILGLAARATGAALVITALIVPTTLTLALR
jgi:hypothetical protein